MTATITPPGTRSEPPPEPSRSRAGKHEAAESRHGGRRRAVPTVIQMESVECGAASLAMVLGYYGRFVPLEELRAVCGVSRDGAKASSIIKAARRYGLVAKGFQMEAAALRTIRKPAIIFWAFQHFMVVEGIRTRFGKTEVAVNDPASGPRYIDWADFDSGFTGVVLTFEPGPDFVPGGKPTKVGRALLGRRMPTGRALPLVLLASLLLLVPGLLAPAFSRVFIDRVMSSGDVGYLIPLLAAMGITATAMFVLTSVQRHYLLRIETRMSLVSSAKLFRHLLRLPVNCFLQRQPAEVARRVSSNDMIAELLSRDLAATVVNLVLVTFYAMILIRYDTLLGVIGISTATLNIFVLRWVARARTDAAQSLRADRGKLTVATYNTLQLIETVKATGAEPEAFERWSGMLAKVVTSRQKLGLPTAVVMVTPPLLAGVNTGLILLVGGLRVIDGAISAGMLVAFQSLLAQLSRPITQITNLGDRLQEAAADITRLHDIEQHPVAGVFSQPPGEPEGRLDGYLEFDNVTFGYGPLSPPVIKELSLSLVPGRRVAIVGGSGSGKSTVGRLVVGLYEPWSGQVLLDGRPRNEIPHPVVAASVAYVDQDISLFEGTIRDNLTLWNEEIPDDVVISALRDAAIFEVIAARPGGIHSWVREGGRNFSGGQRQRLDIARALVTQPTLLVLDEATSALDPETEHVIADNLRRRGCACLIVAHRLSTIRDADEIIVLDHSAVVERGTHAELMAAEGRYAQLVSHGEET